MCSIIALTRYRPNISRPQRIKITRRTLLNNKKFVYVRKLGKVRSGFIYNWVISRAGPRSREGGGGSTLAWLSPTAPWTNGAYFYRSQINWLILPISMHLPKTGICIAWQRILTHAMYSRRMQRSTIARCPSAARLQLPKWQKKSCLKNAHHI